MLVFLHIPKTAGTTVRQSLQRYIPRSRSLHIWARAFGADVEPQEFASYDIPDGCGFITGHINFRTLFSNRKLRCLTDKINFISIVRDPVDMIISYYNYTLSYPSHPDHDYVKGVGFSIYAEKLGANVQCGYLSCDENLDIDIDIHISAIDNLAKTCCVVVNKEFGVEPDEGEFNNRLNVTSDLARLGGGRPKLITRAELPDDLISYLYEVNSMDFDLYKRAKEKNYIDTIPRIDI